MPAGRSSLRMPSPQKTTLRFRQARDVDAEALAALINEAFAVERPVFDGDRTSPEGVRAYMSKGTFLVVHDGDEPAGCVYGELRGTTGYVGLLSVRPSRQSTGLGRKLMEAVEEFFRKAGCTQAELRVVSARTPLPAFYKHLGYMESRTESLPDTVTPKIPCHFIYMAKNLTSR
jgi:GNAT superfamily N-acetyltransferase